MATSPSQVEFTRFIDAARKGRIDDVRDFLKAYPSAVNDGDGSRFTALHWAVTEGREDVVSLLLQNGADVNIPGLHDTLPLGRAAMDGKAAIAKILLDAGADVNGMCRDRTILMSAVFHDTTEETVDLLIGRGATLNNKDQYDETALLYALDNSMYARRNSTAADHARRTGILRKLLAAGADPNQKWGDDRTPLIYAIFNNAPLEAAAALLAGGANATLNDKDKSGRTALFYAVEKEKLELVEMLIRHGADASILDENGKTAEESARSKGLSAAADFARATARALNDKNFKQALDNIKSNRPAPNPFKKTPPKP